MRIGFDAHSFIDSRPSGIAEYIIKILEILDSEKTECFLFSRKEQKLKIKNEHFHSIVDEGHSELPKPYWDNFILPDIIKKNKIDLYHAAGNFGVPSCRQNLCKMVLTIHDIAPAVLVDYYKKQSLMTYRDYMVFPGLSARFADKIIAVSENTKNDVVKVFNINPDKIDVIHQGTNEKIKQDLHKNILKAYQEKYNFGDNYVVYLSEIGLRKNHDRLIEAFDIFKKNDKQDIKLLLIGKAHSELVNPLKKTVNELGQDKNIIFLDFMPEKDLAVLLTFAKLMIFPSLYEGFGLPLLEAMSCGCPVVCSNNSSLPEVGGDAVLMFDPYNTEEMAYIIKKAIDNDALRKELVKKGFERIKKFSWRKTQKKTFEIYKKLLNLK